MKDPRAMPAWTMELTAVMGLLLVGVCLNRVALYWAVEHETQRNAIFASNLAAGTTPFRWEMEDRRELNLSPSRGIRVLSLKDGCLQIEAEDDDPYLFLDLGRTRIPAGRFNRLVVEWHHSVAATIQVHFWEPDTPDPRASEKFDMPPGRSRFALDLGQTRFFALERGGDRPVVWGGDSGVIELFRVDLGETRGARVTLDRIALEPSRTAPGPPFFVELDSPRIAAAQAAQIAGRLEGPLVAVQADGRWATPEQMLGYSRDFAVNCGLPFFPEPVREADLREGHARLPGWEWREGADPALEWAVSAACLIALVLVVLILLRPAHGRSTTSPLIAALVVWAALQATLWAFHAPGSDARVIALGAVGAAALVVTYARLGTPLARFSGMPRSVWHGLRLVAGMARRPTRNALLGGAAITLAGFAAIAALGHVSGSLGWKASAAARLPEYLVKALAQQLLLGPLFAGAFCVVTGEKRLSSAIAASLFAALHLPNFNLCVATLVFGYAWARLFLAEGDLLTLTVSHALLGTVTATFWGPPLLASHRVGALFFLP